MTLNIPVPISQLERTEDLPKEQLFVIEKGSVTHSMSWASMLSLVEIVSDTLTFGFGSVELPSLSFVSSDAGFYSPQLGSVAVSTNYTRKLLVGSTGLIEFGDVEAKDNSLTTIKSKSSSKCNVRFLQNLEVEKDFILHANIQLNGEINFDDVNINGDKDGGDLTILGEYVRFGKDCGQSLTNHNLSRFLCDATSNENFTIVGNLDNTKTTFNTTLTTNNLTVNDQSTLNLVESKEPIRVDDGGVVIFDNEGNLTTEGDDANITAGKIFGDGQGLTNLNLPSSLRLKGSIDPTTQGPGTPQHGDVWYSTATGNFTNDWVGLEGQDVKVGQSFYYFETPTPKWVLGALTDLQSPYFMIIDLDQEVTGTKTHNALIVAENTIDTGSSDIEANNLVLTGKGTSELTVSGVATRTTLTTKSYVDARMSNATFDFPLKKSKYIIGLDYDGSLARTWDLDASSIGTDNVVVRNDLGNFSANQITASFLHGRAVDGKTLDVGHSSSNTEHQFILSTGVAPSQMIFCDSDFTYNPTNDTIRVDQSVSDITGDVTGNASTTTALETPRTLWGQEFDGTADVEGDLISVGNVTPSSTDQFDLGSEDNVWANIYATTFRGVLLGDVEIGNSTRQTLTNGTHILGGPWNGSSPITWSVDSTPDNLPEKIVVRDDSGSFSSNVITALRFHGPLTGNVTGNVTGSSGSVTGNSATASAFETPRDLWGQEFDGTSDISGDIDGTGNILPSQTSTFDLGSISLPYQTLYVDFVDGDIPNNTTSTDKVNNSLVRGEFIEGTLVEWNGSVEDTWSVNPDSGNIPGKLVVRNQDGDFEAGTITSSLKGELTGNVDGNVSGSSGSVTGNAFTTTAFETPRDLWGQEFDGTSGVSGEITGTGDITPLESDVQMIGREDIKYSDVYATTFHGYLNDNVNSVDQLDTTLSTGSYITANDWNGSADVYWNVFARTGSVNNSVVLRSTSGNIEANTITSHLSGPVNGDVSGNVSGTSSSCTGNAATMTKLQNRPEVRMTFTGVLTGSGVVEYVEGSDIEMLAVIESQIGEITISNLDPLPE